MKRVRLCLLGMLASLLLVGIQPIDRADAKRERQTCSHSSRGWELNAGGKPCRVMVRIFVNAVREDGVIVPTAGSCHTTRPGRRWYCGASKYRTMNMSGEIGYGRVWHGPNGWIVGRISYPTY